jgi:hypothetical protein
VLPETIPDRLLAPLRRRPAAAVILAEGAAVNRQAPGIASPSATRPASISVRASAATHSRVDRDDTRKPSASPAHSLRAATNPARR